MRFPARPAPNLGRAERLALVLAAVAGFVDVVGFLTLHHLFTAHMTGNTSKLGVALGRGELGAALPFVIAPILFVAGIAAGTALVDTGGRWLALGLEGALIASYMGYGSTVVRHGSVQGHALSGFYVLAAVATLALGLQTAALTQIHGATIRTSYVSGVLTNLAQAGVRRLLGRERDGRPLTLLAGIWLAYVGGAVLGSYTLGALAMWCLAIPTAALLLAAARDRTD